MTSAGLTGYGYDDENQLTVAAYMAADWSTGWRTELTYDGKMRLRKQLDYNWNSTGGTNGSWVLGTDRRLVYDGMLVVQERNGSNLPLTTYTRGPDLSGTLQDAGGIGGMLGRSQGYSGITGAWAIHHHYHADGNGNITYLVNDSEGLGAVYKYDPFGNNLTTIGTIANTNHYRFSSKLIHPSSTLYYYGYRFYNPNLQRWINADPIQELGGINLYRFNFNDPILYFDGFGFEPGCMSKCMNQRLGDLKQFMNWLGSYAALALGNKSAGAPSVAQRAGYRFGRMLGCPPRPSIGIARQFAAASYGAAVASAFGGGYALGSFGMCLDECFPSEPPADFIMF